MLFSCRLAESFVIPFVATPGWLGSLARSSALFVPAVAQDKVHWHRLGPDMAVEPVALKSALSRIRASEPVKSFFFSPREQVATFPEKLSPPAAERRVLFGVKNCDILPLLVHERMFLEGEFKDTFYQSRLENTVLVAADCPLPEDSCFCTRVGRKPFVTEGADANLSLVDDGLLLEPLTAKGEELAAQARAHARAATAADLAFRQASREAALAKLAQFNPVEWRSDPAARIAKLKSDSPVWKKHASTCVECFGCLMTCPTCYCFLLYDAKAGEGLGHDPKSKEDFGHVPREVERTKVWDACFIAAYQRVGGGANPRADFLKRFANRFQCKFQYFKDKHGFFACSGCGRCVKVCMGKIDLRNVIADA